MCSTDPNVKTDLAELKKAIAGTLSETTTGGDLYVNDGSGTAKDVEIMANKI